MMQNSLFHMKLRRITCCLFSLPKPKIFILYICEAITLKHHTLHNSSKTFRMITSFFPPVSVIMATNYPFYNPQKHFDKNQVVQRHISFTKSLSPYEFYSICICSTCFVSFLFWCIHLQLLCCTHVLKACIEQLFVVWLIYVLCSKLKYINLKNKVFRQQFIIVENWRTITRHSWPSNLSKLR